MNSAQIVILLWACSIPSLEEFTVMQGWKAKSPYTFCSTVCRPSASQQEKENKKGSNKKPY